MNRDITIHAGSTELNSTLTIPPDPIGVVIFSHGTGSGRKSPRNRFVAEQLNEVGIATLLLDLLTVEEEQKEDKGGVFRFDVRALSERLAGAIVWCNKNAELSNLPIGVFGASTGAASALLVAAEFHTKVVAVVSRGGRPDLATDALTRVICPTLFIVGEADQVVLELNRKALAEIKAKKELAVVKGATHLFEEPLALEEVARLASGWFVQAFSAPETT